MRDNFADETIWLFLLRHWKEIAKAGKEISEWLFPARGDASPILIIGAGGVGKTTTGKLLAGKYDPAGEYEESIGLETFNLKDASGVQLLIPPGQEHRRNSTWTDLQMALANGTYRGMIIVNSYGFHSLGELSYKRHRLFRGSEEQFINDYLADRRLEEIGVLQRLAPHMRSGRQRFWVLSLVTKQDLWWPDKQLVADHYEKGEYGKLLGEVHQRLGDTHVRLETVYCTLVRRNFVTGENEELWRTSAGYEEKMQVESIKRLWSVLGSLKAWEGAR